ncbi:MAG: dTDP-4-dehydrorhamnose reductase [Planctomycetota bacterium]
MTRFLVTGAGGQLGRALVEALGAEAVGPRSAELDVRDEAALAAALAEHRPAWVLNCAAATKVDRCETEVAWAEAVNARAPGAVARACQAGGAGLVHYSTDFVFDGLAGRPYVEDDPKHPLSVYGRTKSEGEDAVLAAGLERCLVLRTQWVYGPGGRNFPAAILARARAGEPLRVVDDQVGQPTLTLDLADMTLALVAAVEAGRARPGLYHAADVGPLSWWDFARKVCDRAGFADTPIERIPSEALALPAPRPADSTLDCSKLAAALGRALPTVDEGFERYARTEGW